MGAGKRGGVSGGDAFSICWSTAAISMPLVKDVYTTFALPSKGISFLGDCQRNSGPVPLVLIPSTSLRAEESALAERRAAAEKAREESATMAAKVRERRAAAALGVRQKLTDGDLKPEESLLLQFLKDLRKTLAEEIQTEAKQNGVPVRDTLIFENSSLIEMAQRRPTNIDTFGDISGVGLTKKDRFGKRFTDEIGKYCKEHGLSQNLLAKFSLAGSAPVPASFGAWKLPPGRKMKLLSQHLGLDPAPNSCMESTDLFVSGRQTIQEIADFSGKKFGTIRVHLSKGLMEFDMYHHPLD
eukprot:216158_1